ncbi:MAG: peptide deformylase [Pseudomonadota bacterium]
MSLLKILHFNDPSLSQKCVPVEKVDSSIKKLIEDMYETMFAAPGIGLSANQVGKDHCLFVYDQGYAAQKTENEEIVSNPKVLINPKLVSKAGLQKCTEGCLSVPEFEEEIERYETIKVEAYNEEMEKFVIEASGFHAVVIQHEMDHLQGLTILDQISRLKKQLYVRRYNKEIGSK